MSIPVVPAIIPKSLEHLLETLDKVSFSNEVQIDLVDGKFVEAVSWPYEPPGDPLNIKRQLDQFTLEIDLMVENPIEAAYKWLEAGADMIIFHVESIALDVFKSFADVCDCSVGIAAHGETTVETIAGYAEYADYIQLMGIREIGAQGQEFDESVLGKVEELRQMFPDMTIAVDGSVNENTIVKLKEAGVTRMVSGSAIVGQDNPKDAHDKLSALIN